MFKLTIQERWPTLDITALPGVHRAVALHEAKQLATMLNTPVVLRLSDETVRIGSSGKVEPL